MSDKRFGVPTVLCVDDEPYVLRALERTLRPFGWRVLTAEKGEDALALLEHECVNVLICDAAMPEMTGLEVLRRAARLAPATARILLTALCNDQEIVVPAVNEGEIFRLLSKPWHDDEVRKAVVEALGMTPAEWEEHRQVGANPSVDEAA